MGSSSVDARLGSRFGPYELQSVVGIGGMGEVYRAYDTVRERVVALKLLRPDMAVDPTFRDRFRRESRIAARLQEPHVIPVHDFGEIDGVLYIDMRLVEGASLKDLLRDGVLPASRASWIVGQVASALDAAHANQLVHRDIKPENVLLTPDDFAYLVDFGIAYGGGEATVTKTGMVIGSCAYMAPERLNGEPGGPAADVYSLTCLLYELLTGRAPFEAGDLRQVMSAHLFSPPPRPSIMRRGVPGAFDEVIAKGMAKDPAQRYASAGELARAASAAASGRVASPPAITPPAPPSAPPRPPRTKQFTAMQPPAYTSHPSLPVTPLAPPRPAQPKRRSKLSRSQKALVAGIAGMLALAAVLAGLVVSSGGTTEPRRGIGVPSTTSEAAAPTTTTNDSPISGVSGTDAQGFVGHTARCDEGTTPAAMIRTKLSLAVICERSSGTYYYKGERLRDGANLRIDKAVPVGDGFEAVNPPDGLKYRVAPDALTISSGRGTETDPALEYGAR